MGLGIITVRLLLAACMVLIIGYVFGGFSKSKRLTIMTKIASILIVILFVSANIFAFRFGNRHFARNGQYDNCDSTFKTHKIYK